MADGSWILYIFNHQIDPAKVSALSKFSSHPTSEQLSSMLSTIDSFPICCGHSDLQYVERLRAKKGKILSVHGETSAYLDDGPFCVDGERI